jgi:hypothetical protein
MFRYYIYDESGELMRKVRSLHEAKEICAIRNGWSFVKVKTPKVKIVFEDAPF